MKKIYIGIDNGTSGSIGIVREGASSIFMETPVFKEQSYTKAKKNISRIASVKLREVLSSAVGDTSPSEVMVVMERPLVNPGRFIATMSALRALEATLVVVEGLGYPHMYVDSRDWQKKLLPKDAHGEELKSASHDIGIRLFPHLEEPIRKHGDADGILMAEWARREGL